MESKRLQAATPILTIDASGFTPLVSTTLDHTTAQVKGDAEDWAMGATRGYAWRSFWQISGKGPAWSSMAWTPARPSWTLLTTDWHLMCSAVFINDEAWEPNRTLRRQ
jgi:hypothetical protein